MHVCVFEQWCVIGWHGVGGGHGHLRCNHSTDPYIVIINWMLARSMSRLMHVVGMRVAALWSEVGNAGGNVSVVAAAVAWLIIC